MKLSQKASFGTKTCNFELPRRTEEVRIAVRTCSCMFEPPSALITLPGTPQNEILKTKPKTKLGVSQNEKRNSKNEAGEK